VGKRGIGKSPSECTLYLGFLGEATAGGACCTETDETSVYAK